MTTLTAARIGELLQPYASPGLLTDQVLTSLQTYLELLLRWNAQTNLSAIREPDAVVQRQMGESLFAAQFLPGTGSLLDFGSGAGFPGVPLQIVHPGLRVTLAESQGKKASFLREVVRTLTLPCEVWASRVEQIAPDRRFDVVAMRAVDHTEQMLPIAAARVSADGMLLRYTASRSVAALDGWSVITDEMVPGSEGKLVWLKRTGL